MLCAKTSRRVGNWTHVLSVFGVHILDIGCETHGFGKQFSSWYSPCHCVLVFFVCFAMFSAFMSFQNQRHFFAVFLKYAGFSTFLRAFLFYRQGQSSRLTGQSHSRLWQSFETSCFQCSPISIARICNAWSKPGYKCVLSSKLETWKQLASTNAMRYRYVRQCKKTYSSVASCMWGSARRLTVA